jgi:hypothetical protein
MNTKTTNTAASAKSGKAAAATKGRKQSRLANAETNSIGARAPRGGGGSKRTKKPFVL